MKQLDSRFKVLMGRVFHYLLRVWVYCDVLFNSRSYNVIAH